MTDHPTTDQNSSMRRLLQSGVIRGDDALDAARRRFRRLFRSHSPRHIAAYRGWGDASRVELIGRVLADRPRGGPGESDTRWDNLLNTYRRFESDEVPGQQLVMRYGQASVEATTDHEGYYHASLPGIASADSLWNSATVSLPDGTLLTTQQVLQVRPDAGIGIISDIDDTVLHSSVTDWKTAAQLAFMHNARTRKPLKGASVLYEALQHGMDGRGLAPVFYVSSSAWNLYDLLEDFMDLNAIPCGPIFLRDLGTDTGKFIKTSGHGHKLDRARELIERYPRLRWVLLGDSGQADAELYAEAAREFGDRIAAIYIRDVDPDIETARDAAVGGHIEKVAGTGVPMLLAPDSLAIARHAADLGLIQRQWVDRVELEVLRDEQRPSLSEAAEEGVVAGDSTGP